MATEAVYGSWDSPITPDLFGKCNCKTICEMQVVGENVYWIEQNAVTGKRELYSKPTKGEKRTRWADGFSVQTAVHEYGGGALHVLNDGSVLFATIEGVFYQKSADSGVEQLAEANNRTFRFADFSATDSHVFCVNENHQGDAKFPENRLISIDRSTKNQNVVAKGADFYAYPRVSPDGNKLVWMQWSHPNMPWDETSIRMADLKGGEPSNEMILKDGGGKQINYSEPTWDGDELLTVNDSTNWWNVYRSAAEPNAVEKNLNPIQREISYPLWQLGFRNYVLNKKYLVMNADGILYVRSENVTVEIPTPGYTVFGYLSLDPNGSEVFAIASGPKRASSVISIDLSNPSFPLKVHRESRDSSEIDALEISEPEEFVFKSDGVNVSGYFYPPKNSAYSAPAGTLPPVLLLGHGGPTAPAQNNLDLKKQFFTSRGIAVFDVNYRGSTGFGTEFRRMLYKNCGVADRDDMLNGAKALVEQGRVDPDKILITGSSAGGYLILSCLISPNNVIKAAVSLYGVADLLALDEDTHKLEKSYNELLIGKYPEEAAIYQERSPIYHIDKIRTPIAFLHGKEDTVVPMNQSVTMFEKVRSSGVTTALQLYDGEGHGFRNGQVIKESTEATFYFLMKAVGIEPSISSKIEIFNPKL
ncbi:Protein CBR-DPF-4 [Caenorhabditis briggsae]|nr:Protein CBR-DPF-4 [Caenorhabditis briggsae]CAP28717.1 Protein CBR-DPF-4 [Caenorhabditis briggsae]